MPSTYRAPDTRNHHVDYLCNSCRSISGMLPMIVLIQYDAIYMWLNESLWYLRYWCAWDRAVLTVTIMLIICATPVGPYRECSLCLFWYNTMPYICDSTKDSGIYVTDARGIGQSWAQPSDVLIFFFLFRNIPDLPWDIGITWKCGELRRSWYNVYSTIRWDYLP